MEYVFPWSTNQLLLADVDTSWLKPLPSSISCWQNAEKCRATSAPLVKSILKFHSTSIQPPFHFQVSVTLRHSQISASTWTKSSGTSSAQRHTRAWQLPLRRREWPRTKAPRTYSLEEPHLENHHGCIGLVGEWWANHGVMMVINGWRMG